MYGVILLLVIYSSRLLKIYQVIQDIKMLNVTASCLIIPINLAKLNSSLGHEWVLKLKF